MKRGLVFIGCMALVLLAGCSVGGKSPSAAARQFYAALEKGDMKALEKYATTETVQTLALFGEKAQEMLKDYGKITGTTEEIDGDTAQVTITFENGEEEELDLIKVNGAWKVTIDK
jgi:hypothetical protein